MLKYSVGLDISSTEFHACISVIDKVQKVTVRSSSKFTNNSGGFSKLTAWIEKHYKERDIPLVVAMEATGVYYENIALFLYLKGYQVSVILPNKGKKYIQATGVKSKNDRIDAQGLARMGAEQALALWEPMDEYFYQLRSLTRQQRALQELHTNMNNQLHAEQLSMYQNKFVLKQMKKTLAMLDGQIKAVNKAIIAHLNNNETVSVKVGNICKIKGVGLLTVAVILAETNGFLLFKNAPQLISYAGYDVVENQSGNHNGKTKISKKGNSHIRRALHMPAFNVVKFKQRPFVQLFERTLVRHGKKMKSYVAVQKKILVLIYSLWKSGLPYEEHYGLEHSGEQEHMPSSRLKIDASQKESSTYHEAVLHKVDILSNESQHASSRLVQK